MSNKIEILRRLVSIDSTTGREEKITSFCAKYLKKNGVRVKKIGSNLITEPDNASGLAFVAHLDAVPIENENQLQLVEKKGRLYGRGTSDMKGAIAVYLEKCREIDEAGAIIVFYSGEEGALPNGLNELKNSGNLNEIRHAIVGEPTSLRLETSCRGRLLARKVFVGKTGHASRPGNTINAITLATKAINSLPKLTGETITVTQLNTFNASNVVPGICKATIDYRFSRHKTLKQAKQDLFKILGKTESLDESPSFSLTQHQEAFFEKLLDKKSSQSFFWTDAAQLSNWGITSANFGPGNVETSHSAKEYVSKSLLEKYSLEIGKIISKYR